MPRPARRRSLAWACLWGVLGLAGLACDEDLAHDGIRDVQADLAPDVATVVELRWTSDQPGYGWVEYGVVGEAPMTTPASASAGVEHRAVLLGLPPFAPVEYEIFNEHGGIVESWCGGIETGGVPAGLPDLLVTAHVPEAISPEPYLLMVLAGTGNFVVIVDRQGRVLWSVELTQQLQELLPMTATLDEDGLHVGAFFMDFGAFVEDPDRARSALVDLGVDGTVRGRLALGPAHHALVELPDGGVLTVRSDLRSWYDPGRAEEVMVSGDALVEIRPDGEEIGIFSTWDWREPTVHPRFYQISESCGDWVHTNGLSYDEESDSVMMSLGFLDTVLSIDRGSGEVLLELGGQGYPVTEGLPFHFQHDAHWTDEGTLLLSTFASEQARIMAIEYEVDDEAAELRQIWSFGEEKELWSIAGGQAIRLANGNTLLNTGYRGQLLEVTPAGEPVWELVTSAGATMIGVSFFEDFYSGL